MENPPLAAGGFLVSSAIRQPGSGRLRYASYQHPPTADTGVEPASRMTWFKVDDKLHSHRKVLRADDLAAIGVWALAGSWCSDNLTDGFIPDYAVARIDPARWRERSQALVRAGLWEVAEHDGEQGWQFHDWLDYNPSRVQVLAERAATAARQKRWRDAAHARRKGKDDAGRNAVTDASSHASVTVYPTRPDPPLKGGGEEVQERDDFNSREAALAHIRATTTASSKRTKAGA